MTEFQEYNGEKLWYHKILLELLVYTASLLKENNIPFWLDGGTLLGAARNGKIIPWDYDIDLCIFLSDADKLCSFGEKIRSDGFELSIDRSSKWIRIIRLFFASKFEFHVDLFPCFIDGDKVITTFKTSYFYFLSNIVHLSEIEFEGAIYPCPKNCGVKLTRFYGSDWKTVPKVLSGNVIYINKYAASNSDIVAEITKYRDD